MRKTKYFALLILITILSGLLARRFFNGASRPVFPNALRPDNQIAWPSTGESAVGSVKDGVLASSSENERARPTASMAKLITALAIMEKQPFAFGADGPTYLINENDVAGLKACLLEGGSALPIIAGMKVTQYQGMQRMLIASDNNMADILVERIFGSEEAYLTYAKEMLKRMGLYQTMVADASGFNPLSVSTPSELVAIGIAAVKNPVIARIVAQRQVRLPIAGLIKNTNQWLGSDGVTGIKTGTTGEAGSCLLFAAGYTGKEGKTGTLVGVIMGAKNHRTLYSDCKDLLSSAKQVFGPDAAAPAAAVIAPLPANLPCPNPKD